MAKSKTNKKIIKKLKRTVKKPARKKVKKTISVFKKIGRPRIWETSEEMEKEINRFFREVEPPTVTGLALFLGYSCRQSFYDAADLPGFSDTIKRARTRCENYAEARLYIDQKPTGAIFALKNFGWSDKKQIEHSGYIRKTLTPEERKKRIEELEAKRKQT